MDTRSKILDIAMNLNRVGNWAADGYTEKQKRIVQFLKQTSDHISSIDKDKFSQPFKKTYLQFLKEFETLEKEGTEKPADELFWAEKMMTWGNILTHRSKLIT